MNSINEEIKENKQVKIHLWDFPDTIYFLIKPYIRKLYFHRIYSFYNSKRNAARNLCVALATIRNYENGYSTKYGIKHPQYISITFFKKTLPLLGQEFIEKLEQSLVAISTSNGLEIRNPKMPIRESPQLYNVIAHIIADGSAPKRRTPYYGNSCQTLRDNFRRNLKLFGKVESSETHYGSVPIITFPKAVTDILSNFFDIQFTFPNRIPKRIFAASLECKTSFLQALFDDDGSMTAQLVVGIHNANIMKEIRLLLNYIGIKTSHVRVHHYTQKKYLHKKDKVTLNIPTKEYSKFKSLIGFSHPQKSRNLELAIQTRNRKQRTRDPNYIEDRILRVLEFKPSKTMELANELLYTINGVRPHLDRMLEEGLIIKSGYKNEVVWDIA